MQTHKDIWFSADFNHNEHIYFNTEHLPTPVVDFIPWPIRVRAVYFTDGTSLFSAGGAGVGIGQTPWVQNVNADGFRLDNVSDLTSTYIVTDAIRVTGSGGLVVDQNATFGGTITITADVYAQDITAEFIVTEALRVTSSGGLVVDENAIISGGTIVMPNIPTTPAGLPSGALWNNNGAVTVAPSLGGSSAAIVSGVTPSTALTQGSLWFDTNSLSLNVLYAGTWVQV